MTMNNTFLLPENARTLLSEEDRYLLTQVGLPIKILSNSFDYYHEVTLDQDSVVLGTSHHVKGWLLKLNTRNGNIYMEGKGQNTGFHHTFFNSSLKGLLTCLTTYDFYMKKLIQDELLGEYQIEHEKYAKLLRDYIGEIDPKACEEGIWFSLIDDMDVGIL